LNKLVPFPSSIIDNKGKVLISVAWQDICKEFLRKVEDTEKACINRVNFIEDRLDNNKPYISYTCPHGLTEYAFPIIIDGIYLANFITGHFFQKEPDLELYKQQANNYGFDENKYIEAVKKVPILSIQKLEIYLDFIKTFLELITTLSLNRLREKKSNQALLEENQKTIDSEKTLADIVRNSPLAITFGYPDGRLEKANQAYFDLIGYSLEELKSIYWNETLTPPKWHNFESGKLSQITPKDSVTYEKEYVRKDGSIIPVELNVYGRFDDLGNLVNYVAFVKDISKHKLYEKTLVNAKSRAEENERQIKTIINTIPDLIWLKDAAGKYLRCNQRFEDFFGATEEEIEGKTDYDFVSADLAKFFRDNDKKAMQAGKPTRNEEEITFSNDGHKEILDTIKTPIYGQNNEILGVLGIGRDITSLKKAEQALIQAKEEAEQNEQKFKSYVEQSPMAVYVTDINGDCIFVNNRWKQMASMTDDEAMGQGWIKALHPDDMETVSKSWYRSVEENGNWAFEYRFRDRLGKVTWVEGSARPIYNLSNELIGYLGSNLDITARKEAENEIKLRDKHLRSLVENPAGYLVYRTRFDRTTGKIDVIQVSPSYHEILGIDKSRINDFEKWFLDVYPDDLQSLKEASLAGMQPPFKLHQEIRYVHPSEGLKWIDVRATGIPYSDDPNMIEYANGIIIDITERKKSEQELLKMENLKKIGTLAGGIAHDFNNILAGLYGNISLAIDELNEYHPSYALLKEAENSMSRATKLTHQLLTFSKGGLPVKQEQDLAKIIEETVRFDLSGSPLMPIFNFADNLQFANVDKGQMHQVFSNLAINAMQASPNGGHLFITASNLVLEEKNFLNLPQGQYIKIIIKDEGIGIPQDHLNRIFDPYFTTKQNGNGLGLSITYSIIKKHNGHLEIESELGVGSSFIIYLPASEKTPKPDNSSSDSSDKKTKRKTKVLIMDDDKVILTMLSKILNKFGIDADLTTDGEQTITKYQESFNNAEPYGLVILDLTIPGGMGGKETVKKILAINEDAKVIVSSGYASGGTISEYKSYGFIDMIQKPYSMAQLKEMLFRVLDEK
jgi:PAS domain S-box-containing protein